MKRGVGRSKICSNVYAGRGRIVGSSIFVPAEVLGSEGWKRCEEWEGCDSWTAFAREENGMRGCEAEWRWIGIARDAPEEVEKAISSR